MLVGISIVTPSSRLVFSLSGTARGKWKENNLHMLWITLFAVYS